MIYSTMPRPLSHCAVQAVLVNARSQANDRALTNVVNARTHAVNARQRTQDELCTPRAIRNFTMTQ